MIALSGESTVQVQLVIQKEHTRTSAGKLADIALSLLDKVLSEVELVGRDSILLFEEVGGLNVGIKQKVGDLWSKFVLFFCLHE